MWYQGLEGKGQGKEGHIFGTVSLSLGRCSSLNLNWPTELDIPPSTRSGE